MPDSNLLPQQVGERYTVGEVIGKGGMGLVYKGTDTTTMQPVAIKMLKSEMLTSDLNVLDRFKREAEALRQLNHPNIVKVLDTIDEGDQHYIVMEYVGGGTLADIIAKDELVPVKRTLEIGLELADALSRAHHLKIIHRDIKPSNVLLAEDGTPRLTDFGVAHMETDERMTEPGMAVGTLHYLSPEALTNASSDTRADIWSFGVMLFEMLCGQRPFEGGDARQVLSSIMMGKVPDIKPLNPDVPDELTDLINRMLVKDADKRIASARQVGAEIEAILRGDSTNSGVRFKSYTPTPARITLPDIATSVAPVESFHNTKLPGVAGRRKVVLGAAAAVIIVVILIAGVIALVGSKDDTPDTTPVPTTSVVQVDTLPAALPEGTAEASAEAFVFTRTLLDDDHAQFTGAGFSITTPSDWVDLISSNPALLTALQSENEQFIKIRSLLGDEGLPDLLAANFTAFTGVAVRREELPTAMDNPVLMGRQVTIIGAMGVTILESSIVSTPLGDLVRLHVELPEAILGLRQLEMYFVMNDSTLYWIMFFAPESDFESSLPIFEDVLATFQFQPS